MTIRKKLFYSNVFLIFMALVILLGIGGCMISLFKDEFLKWYGGASRLSDSHYQVYQQIPEMKSFGGDWNKWAEALAAYEFHILVMDEEEQNIYSNLQYNEWEGAEALLELERTEKGTETYFVEGITILRLDCFVDGSDYILYLTNTIYENSIHGVNRGMFETFLSAFLMVGIMAIVAILFCSQAFTKSFIGKILLPMAELEAAAGRVAEGNLSEPIAYAKEDEYKSVCDSFDFMQKNLREGMEKNAAYEKARTDMINGISHDLRTPLTSIKGYIKGMLDGVANTREKRQEYLETAYRKSCDMDALLSKLFYFSKLETGNMPFFKQKTDIQTYLSNYAAEKQTELAEKDGKIVFINRMQHTVFCNLDQVQFSRILDNLVENAIKYAGTQKGLVLTIKTEQISDSAVIDFSDNGEGVAEDKLGHIFEQFYRGDESRNSDGNGLGLYVCRYIVKGHDGSIHAYNQNGLHIRMLFPILKEECGGQP